MHGSSHRLRRSTCRVLVSLFAVAVAEAAFLSDARAQSLAGTTVTPHLQSSRLRWRRPQPIELAARVELFVTNDTDAPLELGRKTAVRFDDRTADELLSAGTWAWHDTPTAWLADHVVVPPGGLTVLAFNGKSQAWGVGTDHAVTLGEAPHLPFTLEPPQAWLERVTFLRTGDDADPNAPLQPNRIVAHLRSVAASPLQPLRCQLWLPAEHGRHQVFVKARSFDLTWAGGGKIRSLPADGRLPPGGAGVVQIDCEPLPLGYAVIEIVLADDAGHELTLRSRLRVKREAFDISGGWVASQLPRGNSLTQEPYLKTLTRMHINTGQIEEVGGYTDNPQRYAAYPLKRFNRLADTARYDTDTLLPTIHAVEFIGEPQYGGGRPVPPQEVRDLLAPYQSTRLPTSVTFSEERNWCHYAGLSDFAHFDAYRVIAPAADSWAAYDRWGGRSIRWGAPLETIGDMTRSLAHHWRPAPVAIWSQGAHDGWGSRWSPRRGSPTPDELRSQAWHGIATGVTSLYWFNLSLKSLLAFPDLIDPITRVNREAMMLEDLFLAASQTSYERIDDQGQPGWDLTVLASPQAALLAAHDLAYTIDDEQSVFRFVAREAELSFPVPAWLAATQPGAGHVFRIDADGVHDVAAEVIGDRVHVRDQIRVVGLYVLTHDASLREPLAARCQALQAAEQATGFDPAGSADDLAELAALLEDKGRE